MIYRKLELNKDIDKKEKFIELLAKLNEKSKNYMEKKFKALDFQAEVSVCNVIQ